MEETSFCSDETEMKLGLTKKNIAHEGAGDNYSWEVPVYKIAETRMEIASDRDDEEDTKASGRKPYTEDEGAMYLLGWLVPVCQVIENKEESSDSDDEREIWWRVPVTNTKEETGTTYHRGRKAKLCPITEFIEEPMPIMSDISDEKGKDTLQGKIGQKRKMFSLRGFSWLSRKQKKVQKEKPVLSDAERMRGDSRKYIAVDKASTSCSILSCFTTRKWEKTKK